MAKPRKLSSVIFAIVVALVIAAYNQSDLKDFLEPAQNTPAPSQRESSYGSDSATLSDSGIDALFAARRSDAIVTGEAVIQRVLSDDNDGSRHQRLVLELPSGLTVLIAHNIDIAPRVPNPQVGANLRFRGEYEWNERGGVVHWTHRDLRGSHPGGWLEYRGQRYE